MRKKLKIFLSLLLFLSGIIVSYPEGKNPKPKKILEAIHKIELIDVHSHPMAGDVKYDPKDEYPKLEPLISRPFWPIEKKRVAVVDSLEVDGLRELFGYEKEDVTLDDIPLLEKLGTEFWKAGKREAFNRVLDICKIEKIFCNSVSPEEDLDQRRVLWVPFVDPLFYVMDPSSLKAIAPELREALRNYKKADDELAKKFGLPITDLRSYLKFVDAVLEDYRKNKAVALKVASAYIRTLWFDRVEEEEATKIFEEAKKGKISSWQEYKRLQDFIARYVFLKAGELNLPVHFHTGFGYTATLKNLDSNPLNLESVFSELEFKKTKFVMLHAGYPHWDKLKPMLEKRNVFVEFSAVNWMVFDGELSQILYEWLSYHGISEKLMFGSDAGTPIFFWIAAENSRKALSKAMRRLVEEEIVDEEKAISLAKKVMRENARRVHQLE